MTPGYTPETIAIVLRCLRVQTEGPGPICPVCVHQTGLVAYDEQSGNRITAAGHLILALADERDLWRLRCEWQEAIVACMRAWNSASAAATRSNGVKAYEAGIAEHERCHRWEKAARAAYVAAGGTP